MDFKIDYKDWKKIYSYAKIAHAKFGGAEIGGMAIMEEIEKGEWWLKDPVILEQDVTGGSCSLDQEKLANYYTEVGMKRKKNPNKYRFLWWHSHHTLGAFWSGTDDKAIEEFSDGDVSFALVVSWNDNPDEHILRVSYWDPIEAHVDTEFNVVNRPETKIAKSLIDEVMLKCNRPTAITINNSYTTNRTKWQQQALFDNRHTLPHTIKKLEESNNKEVPFNSNEVFLSIIELLNDMNAKFIAAEIDFKEWQEELEKVEQFALRNDYIIITPCSEKIALDWIQFKEITEWIEYDPDYTNWNDSFGVKGYH